MRFTLSLVFASCFLLTVRAERLPLEDFVAIPVIGAPTVSGDGKSVAFVLERQKGRTLVIADWDSGKVVLSKQERSALSPIWINNDVVADMGAEWDRRSGRVKEHNDAREYLGARFSGDRSADCVYLVTSYGSSGPRVVRADSRTGAERESVLVPRGTVRCLLDGAGNLRALEEWDESGTKTRISFRPHQDDMWLVPAGLDFAVDGPRAFCVSGDGKLLYLSKVTPDGTWGIYSYDLERQKFKDLVLSHTKFDIVPGSALVLAPRTKELLGIYYHTDEPHVLWLDADLASVQEALDRALPGQANRIVSLSDDRQRMILLSSSPSDPGTYYLFDGAKVELKPLMARMPWIKPRKMGTVRPVAFQSRDGLTLHGYLTVPAGKAPKNLPLVVLPHTRFEERDELVFNMNVQFLANRGYAVLQVNYRGSTGYGLAFNKGGYRRIGAEVQDDITDGVRWAIAEGMADPRRVGIMGAQFGGYSALMGAMADPPLYRCAISISGTTNWGMKKKNLAHPELFKERFGDPEADAAYLAQISPVNNADKIKIPLLLVYDAGQDDYKELRESFSAFTKRLKQSGKTFESLDYHNEYASLDNPKERVEMLGRIEKFLAKHMPAE